MKRFLGIVTLVTLALTLLVTPVLALGSPMQTPGPESPAIDFLIQLLFGIAITVPGFTALGVVIVNVLKIPGWVNDGNAQIALNIFNVFSAVLIGIVTLFLPAVDIPGLDITFGKLASVLTVLLPTFVLLYKWLAPYFYKAIRGFPLIGYSYTLAKARVK